MLHHPVGNVLDFAELKQSSAAGFWYEMQVEPTQLQIQKTLSKRSNGPRLATHTQFQEVLQMFMDYDDFLLCSDSSARLPPRFLKNNVKFVYCNQRFDYKNSVPI